MRHALLGLMFLVFAPAVGDDTPIPQDPIRIEMRARDRLEWNRLTLRDAFNNVGRKDPKWDRPAREALELAAQMFSQQLTPSILPSDVHAPAKKAVDAGCDDALVLYLHARTSVGKNSPGEEGFTRGLQAAWAALSKSGYSPLRKAAALVAACDNRFVRKPFAPEYRAEVEQGLDTLVDLMASSVAEDPRNEDWDEAWYSMINSAISMHKEILGDYKAAFDRVEARLSKVPGCEALRLTIRGNFLIHWGWEARGDQFAAFVGEERFRTFGERLQAAREALTEAWKLDPRVPHIAELMLTVEKANGNGDRQAMETWFDRAMKADGNDYESCWAKLDWLDPKWHGDDAGEEMLAFGKACRETKNWRTGIILLAADAHLRYHRKLDRMDGFQYLRRPEVWSEIKSVYDEYLKHFPKNSAERSKYAALCYISARYPEAHAQFQILGDRLTVWKSYPNYPLETLKSFRDEAAKQVAAKR